MTVQLATRIDSKTKTLLNQIHRKTHIPIRQLTETAIVLLDGYYRELQKSYRKSDIDTDFHRLLAYSMKKHDKTYQKLAE